MSRAPPSSELDVIGAALSTAVGAALVLDAELRVVLATREAARLLGAEIPLGVPAVKVLCKSSPERPVALALAEGRPVQAVIAHPAARPGATRLLKVNALPLGKEGRPRGYLLLLDEALEQTPGPECFHGLWTQSPLMKQVFRVVERVAADDASVLVRGETGTGKELTARAIHDLSPRRAGPFRAINCAALPATLLESELFGHVRGAFTGAVSHAKGHFQLASGGTLFLDEVGEMPLELQAKLLRTLETRTVLPIGAHKPVSVDVRIVSATHRALRQEVELGRFRADLMYRLRVIPIFLPALRERREDIALICAKLIEAHNRGARRKIERVAPGAQHVLERHDWPGNVRELRNVLAYAYAVGDGPILQTKDLPPELLDARLNASGSSDEPSTEDEASSPEAKRLLAVLEKAGGNKTRAAKLLGVSRVTLWRHLRELGLDDR